jgi:tetratricopeptide (TPR) repeat protein
MKKSLLFACLMLILLPYGPSHASGAGREYSKANKLYAEGRYPEAILLYQALLSTPSRSISSSALHTRIADSYFQLGAYRKALTAYRSALKEQKQSERPQTQYWIGFCAFLLGKDAEAVNEFLKIPELYPGSGMWVATAYYWAGRASERMGKKEPAAEYFRKAGGSGASAQGRFALKKAEAVKGK